MPKPIHPRDALHAMAVHLFETAADMRDLLPPTPYSMSSDQLRIMTALTAIKRESGSIIATLTGRDSREEQR